VSVTYETTSLAYKMFIEVHSRLITAV
jgi:hypothetical protein